MTAPIRERISQVEFNRILALPENQDRQLELWDGEIIETMPKTLHGFMQNLLAALFHLHLTAHPIGLSLTETQIELAGEDYAPVPDIVVVLHTQGAFEWDGPLRFMPALIVEIQSPDQTDKFMRDKADYYIARGCRLMITVYIKRIVEVRTPTDVRLLVPGDTLDGGDVLPGFSVEVGKLYPDMP